MHRAHHCCTGNERGQQDDGQFAWPSPAAPASTVLLLRRIRSCRQYSANTCIVAVPPPHTADPSDTDLRVGPRDCVEHQPWRRKMGRMQAQGEVVTVGGRAERQELETDEG